MVSINPYLNFPGTSEEAFNLYKSVFGGEFVTVMRFKDTPDGEKLSEEEKNKIMHMALPIGDGNILMATDSLESMGHITKAGTNFHLSIGVESKEKADNIFNGLSAGGNVTMPMQDQFWGDYFGMLTDKYGIQWMVSYSYPQKK